jgi:hypothetical protein
VISCIVFVALAMPAPGLAKSDRGGLGPASLTAACRDRPDVAAIIEQARADGFTIAPGVAEALERVPDVAGGAHRVLVGTKGGPAGHSSHAGTNGPQALAAARTPQSPSRVAAGDVASLGCPVGSAAHVNWNSGMGYVQEYWRWATIGGQTGTSSPAAGYCYQTTCRWYAWAAGVQNRYYRSVSVYNTWYAFIINAGCGY